MKIKLGVKDRVMLLEILPKTGKILFIKMVREVMEQLSFSQDEQDQLKFTETRIGHIVWDEAAALEIQKEIEIPQTIRENITSTLQKLEEAEKLSIDHLNLYEIFVCNKKETIAE